MDLFIHAYKTSPEFYYPYQRTFQVFDREVMDKNSNLKWKAIDCILLVLDRQPNGDKVKDEMCNIFSIDTYNKVIRKLGIFYIIKGKNNNMSVGSSHSGLSAQHMSPITSISPKYHRKSQQKKRLITD